MDNLNSVDFGNKLYHLRLDKEKTQQEVAEAIGVSQAAYSYMESGKTDIGIRKLHMLSKFYGMKMSELMLTLID